MERSGACIVRPVNNIGHSLANKVQTLHCVCLVTATTFAAAAGYIAHMVQHCSLALVHRIHVHPGFYQELEDVDTPAPSGDMGTRLPTGVSECQKLVC